MKIVLDTNVLVAAFIARGKCHSLVERCLQVHSVITSDFILQEFQEKLTQKFKLSSEDARIAVELLKSRMQIVKPKALNKTVCRDPDDDMVLATALSGGAVCILTGDKDLLALKSFDGIDIISPSEFEAYEEQSAPSDT